MRSVIAVITVLALSAATFVQAESLGEVAAREKEKRKGKKDEKVLTETELVRAKGSGVSMTDGGFASTAAPAAPASGKAAAPVEKGKDAPVEKSEEEQRAERVKDWRTRLAAANDKVIAAQKKVSTLEATPGLFSNAAATQQLADARQALADARAAEAVIEEEGRRSSFR